MRPRLVAIAMAVLVPFVASCSDSAVVRDRGSPAVSADAPEVAAFLALCSARDAAAANEVGTAGAAFEDEAHETLHHLAEEVERTDRAASAALLTAKSDVEADLAEAAPDAATVHGHLEALLEAMGGALEVVGITAPECPETQA